MTINLKIERDQAKKKLYLSPRNPEKDGRNHAALSDSYKADEAATLNKQMEEMKLEDETASEILPPADEVLICTDPPVEKQRRVLQSIRQLPLLVL